MTVSSLVFEQVQMMPHMKAHKTAPSHLVRLLPISHEFSATWVFEIVNSFYFQAGELVSLQSHYTFCLLQIRLAGLRTINRIQLILRAAGGGEISSPGSPCTFRLTTCEA
jgi:hypothetical protein